MDKYIILLPLNYNDGRRVPDEDLDMALDELFMLAGGYSVEGRIRGAYRMKSGQKQLDELLKVWVLIPAGKAQALRALVGDFCRRLGQESMWLEKSDSIVELVEPNAPQGEHP